MVKHLTLRIAQAQAHRQWQGAKRFQHLLERCLRSENAKVANRRLAQLLRVATRSENPYIQTMLDFLERHRDGVLQLFQYLEPQRPRLKQLTQGQWRSVNDIAAIPKTNNAAEHVFRCLRRYTRNMDHFGSSQTAQGFFDLFVFTHNFRTLRAGRRAGSSLLAQAAVDVTDLFGSNDPYTILGFPPTYDQLIPLKVSKRKRGKLAAVA